METSLWAFEFEQSSLGVGSRHEGMVPTAFEKGNILMNINLNGNQLKGPLSQALLNYRNLEVLNLVNNMINDTFPQWLKSLPKLQVLILRSNRFYGTIASSPNVEFLFQKWQSCTCQTTNSRDFCQQRILGICPKWWMEGEGFHQDSVTVTIKGYDKEMEKI